MTSKKRDRRELSRYVDLAITDLFGKELRKRDGVTANMVADQVEKDHPKLVERCGKTLARAQLVAIASSKLRTGLAMLRAAGATTLTLPGIDESILVNVPPLITIPSVKKKGELRHKPVTHATIGELRQYRDLLKKQIEDDKVHFEAVDFIVAACVDQPDNLSIKEACRRAAMEPAI